jgi:hypothetical protein
LIKAELSLPNAPTRWKTEHTAWLIPSNIPPTAFKISAILAHKLPRAIKSLLSICYPAFPCLFSTSEGFSKTKHCILTNLKGCHVARSRPENLLGVPLGGVSQGFYILWSSTEAFFAIDN